MEITPTPSNLRFAARLTNEFVLDLLALGRDHGDVLDALIFASILEPQLDLIAEIGRNAPLDEAGRQPGDRPMVSIGGVAEGLGVPFETVRRRVARFNERGTCTVSTRGVHCSASVLASPAFKAVIQATFLRVRGFYLRLRRAQALVEIDQHAGKPGDAAPRAVEVLRLTLKFVLRTIDPLKLAQFRSPLSALILMEVIRDNMAHLPDSERGSDVEGLAGFLPDIVRRPARVGNLATRLGLVPETVRRHIADLVDEGRCVRVTGGVIVPAAVLAAPPILDVILRNSVNLARLLGSLEELGVLAAWDHEADAITA